MARIAGVDVPREKRVEIGLTYIYGIGLTTSRQILQKTQINPDTRVRDLTEDEVQRVREVIDRDLRVEGDLRREVALNIKRLTEIGCYRGLRHRRNLPVHGQRTRRTLVPSAARARRSRVDARRRRRSNARVHAYRTARAGEVDGMREKYGKTSAEAAPARTTTRTSSCPAGSRTYSRHI